MVETRSSTGLSLTSIERASGRSTIGVSSQRGLQELDGRLPSPSCSCTSSTRYASFMRVSAWPMRAPELPHSSCSFWWCYRVLRILGLPSKSKKTRKGVSPLGQIDTSLKESCETSGRLTSCWDRLWERPWSVSNRNVSLMIATWSVLHFRAISKTSSPLEENWTRACFSRVEWHTMRELKVHPKMTSIWPEQKSLAQTGSLSLELTHQFGTMIQYATRTLWEAIMYIMITLRARKKVE